MKLYEIDNGFRNLWAKIIEQDGELTEEDINALESLNLARDEKVKGYGVVIRESVSEIANIDFELKRLNKIKSQLQNKVEWLTNRLSGFMKENDMNDFKSVEVNISFRTSQSLVIEDETNLPSMFVNVISKPDKQAIKEFIANGGKVDGCTIIKKDNIQIK